MYFQFQMNETLLFRISNFGHWYLFGIWYFGLGASYFLTPPINGGAPV